MATSNAFRVRLADVAPNDAAFRAIDDATRVIVMRRLVQIVLKVRDASLAKGLDRFGNPFTPISWRTRENRRSAMGRPDPNAPPLTPAYGLSRTRSLLAGRAMTDHAEFYWRFDPHTGKSWGVILGYHRVGAGHLPVRDAIGISPADLAIVRRELLADWRKIKAGKVLIENAEEMTFKPGKPKETKPTREDFAPYRYGFTDTANRTYGSEADKAKAERSIKEGMSSGFYRKTFQSGHYYRGNKRVS